MIEIFNKIYDTILSFKGKEIIIVGHDDVDADAIASASTISLFLKKMNINHKLLLERNSTYDILNYENYIYTGDAEKLDCDLFISCDCGDDNRFFEYKFLFDKAKCKINIDHHISNNDFGDINLVLPNLSSTSEIVYELVSNFIDIDIEMARLLYGGIIYDSGGFLHKSTSPRTLQIGSELMKTGIDFNEIYYSINKKRTIKSRLALKVLIDNMEFLFNKQVICATITQKEVEEVGATIKDTDGFVNFLFDTEHVRCAIFIYEKKEGVYKVSLRSRDIDVSKVAKVFGGGGHTRASGCRFSSSIENAKEKVINEVGKHL